MVDAGIDQPKVSVHTLTRMLHRKGYQYLEARKKGILSAQGLKRQKFSRRMKNNIPLRYGRETLLFTSTELVFNIK